MPPSSFFVALLGLTYWVYQSVPRGFIPEDDEGYIIFIVQAPQGASLEYTGNVCNQVEKVLAGVPEIKGVFSVSGFSFSGAAPNRAMIFANLAALQRAQRPSALFAAGDYPPPSANVRHPRRTW